MIPLSILSVVKDVFINKIDFLKNAINNWWNINMIDVRHNWRTPLHWAFHKNNLEIIKILITNWANIYANDIDWAIWFFYLKKSQWYFDTMLIIDKYYLYTGKLTYYKFRCNFNF